MTGKKDYVSVSKQKILSLHNLQELYTAFKEKHPNVILTSQNSIPSDPNGVLWLAKRGFTLFVCSAHQNALLLVHAMGWELPYLVDLT